MSELVTCQCGCGSLIPAINTMGKTARYKLGHNPPRPDQRYGGWGVTKHGHSRTKETRSPEYITWSAMKARCGNPKHPYYRNYGGRGITVHAEWANDFSAFLRDVGERPEPKSAYSIDRIDPDGNYEPGNVRWATRREQRLNHSKRRNNM